LPYKIDDANHATDSELSERASGFVKQITFDVYSKRASLDEKWLAYYRIYRAVFDVKYYQGSVDVFDPQLRKNVEFYVSRLKKALFPTDDLFEVEPVSPDSDEDADVVAEHLKWQIEKKVRIKGKVSRFLRQLVMYGWSPIKCVWEKETRNLVGLTKIQEVIKKYVYDELGRKTLRETGEVRVKFVEEEKQVAIKNNPTFDICDVFDTYVYPPTANSIEEAYGVLEIFRLPLDDVKRKGEEGYYDNTENLRASSSDDIFQWKHEARLEIDGQTATTEIPKIPYVTLIEYWGWFDFGTEDKPEVRQAVITLTNSFQVLQIRRNPFYDQQKPYLAARMTEVQNEFYPDGLIAPLASLQYYINDLMAQTFDSLSYTLNPIVKYDPGRVVNLNTIAFAPGAMWALTDPSAAVLESPRDVSGFGFQAINQVKQIVETYPGVANIPTTGRKAATHITAIQQEYSLPIMDLAENVEEHVFSPWLKMAYTRNQQFLTEEEIFLVAGKKGVKSWKSLSPEMLVGDYLFNWRGANQATNIHVRARQMMEFWNMALPALPAIQQSGASINFSYLLKRIWKEGLGLDGEDKIIQDQELERSIDAQTENMLLAVGKYLPTSSQDNHEEHLQIHQELLSTDDEYARKVTMRHVEEHQFKLQQQKQAMQSMAVSQRGGSTDNTGAPAQPGEEDLEAIQPPNP